MNGNKCPRMHANSVNTRYVHNIHPTRTTTKLGNNVRFPSPSVGTQVTFQMLILGKVRLVDG